MTTNFTEALGPIQQVQLSQGTIDYHERGAGPPLVLVHGALLHAGFWRKVVPGLAENYRCITPTWPLGAHRLPMRREADLSPPGIARLIADFLAALDLQDVSVLANDTGGAFAQLLVTRHPERVGALVLTPSDAFQHFPPWQFRHLQALTHVPGAGWQIAQLLRSATARRSPLGFGLLTKNGIDDAVSATYGEPLRASRGVRRDLTKMLRGIRTRYTIDAAAALPQCEIPVLLAWASEDRVFPIADARRLEELLPNARLEVIEDSYTYVPEDQPERLVELVLEFLNHL